MLSVLAGASDRATLPALRFTRDDLLDDFWRSGLKPRLPADKHAIIDAINEYMIDDHLIITVGQLLDRYYHEVEEMITSKGGKPGWVRSIESLLGATFKRFGEGAPPQSAALASLPPPTVPPSYHFKPSFEEEHEEKLGASLTRTDSLDTACMPYGLLDDALKKTKNPRSDQIGPADTSILIHQQFDFVFAKHGQVGGDKELFNQLGEHLATHFPRPHSRKWKLGWTAKEIYAEKCRVFWQDRRSSRAAVRMHSLCR